MAQDNQKGHDIPKPTLAASAPPSAAEALSPATIKAIQDAVLAAMLALQNPLPQTAPSVNKMESSPVVASIGGPRPPAPETIRRNKLKGIPVNPGEDLRYVHRSHIQKWFQAIEQRAKDRFTKDGIDRTGVAAEFTFTAGTPYAI